MRVTFQGAYEAMTDLQILTLALTLVIELSMFIYSNSRITDAKELLRAEIQAMRAEMRQGLDHLELVIKAHELEHHKVNLR